MDPVEPRSLADLTASIIGDDERQVRESNQRHPPDPPVDPDPLDTAVRALLGTPSAPWIRAGVVSVATTAVVIAATRLAHPHGIAAAGASLFGELAIGLVALATCIPLARASGGWRPALGWAQPEPGDPGYVLRWFFLQYGARLVAVMLLLIALPHLDLKDASNTVGLRHATANEVGVLAIAAVFVAPVVEETIFRGILLRGLMRRLPFAGAALLSSALFGAFHSYEARTATSAVALSVVMAVFGYVQCLLVRRSARLLPAVVVHGLSNLVALLIVFGQIKQ